MSLICRRERSSPLDLKRMFVSSLKKSCDAHCTYFPLLLATCEVEKIAERFCVFEQRQPRSYHCDSDGSVPHRNVYHLVVSELNAAFSVTDYGCAKNRAIFLRYLKHFIGMQFGSKLNTGSICREFQVPEGMDSTWLVFSHGFVYSLLCGVVLSILKKNFRWCELKSRVPTVSYFTLASWKNILLNYLSTLKLATLSPVARDASFPSAVFSHPDLANETYRVVPSIVRLVRKSDQRTFRLVVNRSIRKSGRSHQHCSPEGLPVSIAPKNLSVNERLRCPNGLVAFLSRLKHELPSIYAPSILSVNGAFSSLVRFRKAVATQGHFRFRLAKMDILDCFHSIEHAKLMEVFKEICDYARRYLFPAPDTEHLVHELEWFLRDALILFEGQLYRFQKGLAQGSCICTELANLYLAHADRQLAQGFPLWRSGVKSTWTSCSTVLRYLDDYLCITPANGNLSEFAKRVEANLEHYGLKLNPSKVQSNESTRIVWLGMEIQDDLTIMIPEEPPPRFCRFTGRPLSAEDCLLHLSRARLRSVAWRYAFNPSCGIPQPSLNNGELSSQTRWNSLCGQNAHRLGQRVADLVWVCLKTSPGRMKLLTLPTARQLAICVIRGIRSTLGHKRLEWLRLAVKAFAKRLRPYRGEVATLLSQLRKYLHKCIKMETIRFSPRLYS